MATETQVVMQFETTDKEKWVYPKSFKKVCPECEEYFMGTHNQVFCTPDCAGVTYCVRCGEKMGKRTGEQYADGQICRKCFLDKDRLSAEEKWRKTFPSVRNITFARNGQASGEVQCPYCEEFVPKLLASASAKKRRLGWAGETCKWCGMVLRVHPEWIGDGLKTLIAKHRTSAKNLGISTHEVISILLVTIGRINSTGRKKREAEKQGERPSNITIHDLPIIPEFCPVFPWIKLNIGRILTFRRTAYRHHSSPKMHFSKGNGGVISLDRIIPELGYSAGNVEWVSVRANICKRDATPEELVALGEHGKKILHAKEQVIL